MTLPTPRPSSPRSSNGPISSSASTTTRIFSVTSSRLAGSSASPTEQAVPRISQAGPPTSSNAGSMTGAETETAGQPGSSQTESTNASSQASFPSTIDPNQLTPQARWTLEQVAFRISLGWNEREIGIELGLTTAIVKARIVSLREELRNQA